MKARDLKIGEKYYSRSHKLVMEYCGIEVFQKHRHHNFYEPTWKLFHWLKPDDVTPHSPSTSSAPTEQSK